MAGLDLLQEGKLRQEAIVNLREEMQAKKQKLTKGTKHQTIMQQSIESQSMARAIEASERELEKNMEVESKRRMMKDNPDLRPSTIGIRG